MNWDNRHYVNPYIQREREKEALGLVQPRRRVIFENTGLGQPFIMAPPTQLKRPADIDKLPSYIRKFYESSM